MVTPGQFTSISSLSSHCNPVEIDTGLLDNAEDTQNVSVISKR